MKPNNLISLLSIYLLSRVVSGDRPTRMFARGSRNSLFGLVWVVPRHSCHFASSLQTAGTNERAGHKRGASTSSTNPTTPQMQHHTRHRRHQTLSNAVKVLRCPSRRSRSPEALSRCSPPCAYFFFFLLHCLSSSFSFLSSSVGRNRARRELLSGG